MFNKLKELKTKARKERNKVLVDVINMLLSTIQNYIIANSTVDNKITETDEVVLIVLTKEHKEMSKSLVDYKKYNKEDLIIQTELTLDICEKFLPSKLTLVETLDLIKATVDKYTEADGNKKGFVMKSFKGRTDIDMSLVGRNIGKFL